MPKVAHKLWRSGLLLSALMINTPLFAAAYQLWEQNGGAGVGDYHAGSAAEALDASTAYYNSAGMIRLKHPQMEVGSVFIWSYENFRGTETTYNDFFGSASETGTAHSSAFTPVPNFYFVYPVNSRVAFGIYEATPFGLETNWSNDSIVRYSGTKSSLITADVSPNLAVGITKQFSVGAGIDWEYADVTLNQVDGTFLLPSLDFMSNNTANDWGWGWHIGALYQFNPNVRVGLNYRSRINHTLKGTSKLTWASSGQLVNQSNNLIINFPLPATTTFSIYGQINPQWSLLATAVLTQWDIVQSITLQNAADIAEGFYTNPNVPQNYHNTWNFALGAHYQVNEHWMLRLGGGYDENATNDTDRNIRLPDADRWALAAGFHCQVNRAFGFDMGYTHIFFHTAYLNSSTTTGDIFPITAMTNGSVKSVANIVGVQLLWTM